MEYRIEHDSMGEMKVPADRLWAAQTQRSHENFEIGVGIETMPAEIIHAFGVLKKAASIANNTVRPEKMTAEKMAAISEALMPAFCTACRATSSWVAKISSASCSTQPGWGKIWVNSF